MARSDPKIIEHISDESVVIDWRHAVVAAVLISLFVGFIWSVIASSNAREAERRAADAVTQLAPGIRESWFVAIDQKLGERLVATGGLIKFAESGGHITWAPARLVSVNCSPYLGIWLAYGASEYSPELSLLDRRERPSLGSGVGALSPAAGQLLEEVCERVTLAVRRVGEMR
jgi:hypothetical protein